MIINNINHGFAYHTQKIALMFFPLEKLNEPSEITITTRQENTVLTAEASVYGKTKAASRTAAEGEDMAQAISLLLFGVLSDLTGFTPPWGILYGVRPARLMHAKTALLGEDGAVAFFKKSLVSDKKIDLALEVMHSENSIISLSKPNSFSLYVSIPFCPSRCSYCSFVSHSINNAAHLMEPYVERLCRELEEAARVAKALSLQLETVYFGGGTPTTLSPEQLHRLLSCIETHFDLSALWEYTVEAGRPDTVTREKLQTLKDFGVGRISINPQSFNDEVLRNIGRRHTVEQVYDAFSLARQCGFDNINTDLIAGLSGEAYDSFCHSVDSAVALGAESITVHNLALKSAAYLVTENENYDLSKKYEAAEMIDYSYDALKAAAYQPYYMYRQSKSLGNLENCGWSREGYECLYNVFMMDETHSVFAAGAGAVTKIKHPETGHIERIYNFKYPYEYLNDFDEILKRKEKIFEFYK